MSQIQSQLSNLEKKIEKIIDLYRQSSKELSTLKQHNNELKQTIEQQKQNHKDLEEKYKALKLSKSISVNNKEDNNDLRLKINELVREIDKCVALLNK